MLEIFSAPRHLNSFIKNPAAKAHAHAVLRQAKVVPIEQIHQAKRYGEVLKPALMKTLKLR